MADVPVVGGDKNVWGTKLNTFLAVAHETSGANGGKVKSDAIGYLPSPGTVASTVQSQLRKIVRITDFASNSLNTAVAAIGVTPTTLHIDVTATCTGPLTIPNTLGIVCEREGSINIVSGTLTINGSFDAGLYQVLSGSGNVVFGDGVVKDVYPQWWGLVSSDADSTYATVNQTALQAAIDSLKITSQFNNGRIRLTRGIYRIAGNVNVPSGSRGLTIIGDGPRSTVIKNMNILGQDALRIAPFTVDGDDAVYSLTLRDFSVYGNGAGTDGKGINIKNCYLSHFENLFTENTGRDGFYIANSWQNTYINWHARRAGYNYAGGVTGTNPDIAGLHMVGNTGHVVINSIFDECPYGIIGDTGGFEFYKVDTESNSLGGCYIKGGSNIKAVQCYSEGTLNQWYIGDGTNTIGDALFLGCDFGGAGIVFAKTQYYFIDACSFRYPYSSIRFMDSLSKGHLGTNYYSFVHTSPYYAQFEHLPSKVSKSNFLKNGSFEFSTSKDVFPLWNISIPSGDWTGTRTTAVGSGHDDGQVSLKASCSAYTTGSGMRLYYVGEIDFVLGRIYTLELSFKTTGSAKVSATLVTGGVTHLSNYEFSPTSVVDYKKFVTKFKAQGSLNSLYIYLTGTGDTYIDSIAVYEGETEQIWTNRSDSYKAIEMCHFQDVLAASTNVLYAATQTYSNTAITNQPDVPRIVTVTGSAAAAAGTIVISGIDWKGQYISDTITVTGGAVTDLGAVAFMLVQLATGYDAGAGQTLSIGSGNKFGLPKKAYSVLKQKKNNGNMTVSTLNTTYNTIDITGLSGGDDYTIWFLE